VILGTVGMLLGGLLPLVLGVAGIWTYVRHGYVLSRGGERMHDAWAWLYPLYVLAGLTLIGFGIRFYRRNRSGESSEPPVGSDRPRRRVDG
jgi:hypothetical protein